MIKKNNFSLKKGDTIVVISGKDKGKVSEITEVLRNTQQLVVKDVNIKKKHVKPKKEGDVGRISKFEAPIHRSNVMLYSLEKKVASRTCSQLDTNGKKVRVLKKLL
jgi:large subunit ribosomal protein L24